MNAVGLQRKLEENAGLLIFGILVVSSIGGLVQVLPSVMQVSLVAPEAGSAPYGPVELTGRDIYIREGCATCHSPARPAAPGGDQALWTVFAGGGVRLRPAVPVGHEAHRAGPASRGRALHRPLATAAPARPAQCRSQLHHAGVSVARREAGDCAAGDIQRKMRALKFLGHPYTEEQIANAPEALAGLMEVDALVAYLQGLGAASGGSTP